MILKKAKLSDYTNNPVASEMPDYFGRMLADRVKSLEVSSGQLNCLNSFFQLPANWDFKIWGIEIRVIKKENPVV